MEDPDDELIDHVRVKQEELLEKLRAKRQLSLCGLEEEALEKEIQNKINKEE